MDIERFFFFRLGVFLLVFDFFSVPYWGSGCMIRSKYFSESHKPKVPILTIVQQV